MSTKACFGETTNFNQRSDLWTEYIWINQEWEIMNVILRRIGPIKLHLRQLPLSSYLQTTQLYQTMKIDFPKVTFTEISWVMLNGQAKG